MIAARLNFEQEQSSVLLIILERDNLDRMRLGDPVTLESTSRGGELFKGIHYPWNLSILIAYEEDDVEVYRLARSGDVPGLLALLQRGRTGKEDQDGSKNMFVLTGPHAEAKSQEKP